MGPRLTVGNGEDASPLVWSNEVLEGVVSELKQIARRSGLARTIAIGDVILEHFFDGDPKRWRDQRRNKLVSIRRLAERPDCPFGKSSLTEAVAISIAIKELACVRTFGHIAGSHVAAVLCLPLSHRESLLCRAETERWSVRRLKREVRAVRNEACAERSTRASQHRALSTLTSVVARVRTAEAVFLVTERLHASVRGELAAIGTALCELGSDLLKRAQRS